MEGGKRGGGEGRGNSKGYGTRILCFEAFIIVPL